MLAYKAYEECLKEMLVEYRCSARLTLNIEQVLYTSGEIIYKVSLF